MGGTHSKWGLARRKIVIRSIFPKIRPLFDFALRHGNRTQTVPNRANGHQLGPKKKNNTRRKGNPHVARVDRDHERHWRPFRGRQTHRLGDFGPFLACFGRRPVRAGFVPVGLAEAQRGQKTPEYPSYADSGSQDPFRGLRNPKGNFVFWNYSARGGPFWLRTGPVRASVVPFGPTNTRCGKETYVPGRTGTAKMVVSGPTTHPGGSGTPTVSFTFFGILVLGAGASCLLPAGCSLDVQAHPMARIVNWINQQKYFVLQLGDPNPSLGQSPLLKTHMHTQQV